MMMSNPFNQLIAPLLYIFCIFSLWGKGELELWRRLLGTITFSGMVIFGVHITGGKTLFAALLIGSMTLFGGVLGLLWRYVIVKNYRRFTQQIPAGED